MNIGMRIMTEKDLLRLSGVSKEDLPQMTETDRQRGKVTLLERVLPETAVPEYREEEEPVPVDPGLLAKLGVPLASEASDTGTVVEGSEGAATLDIAKAMAKLEKEQQSSGVVPGSLVQTSEGQVFQPNPTTVTVVPRAQPIRAITEPEPLSDGFEDITPAAEPAVTASTVIPQVLVPQQGIQQGGYYMTPQMPSQYSMMHQGMQVNMGQGPAVYSQPTAQVFNAGLTGAPPTFAIDTSAPVMGGFLSQSMGPDARRSNITLKRNRSFGSQLPQQGVTESSQSDGGMLRVTVVKGA
jgi:hypothetical protein